MNHPTDILYLNTPRRMSIDRMRNQTAKFALEGECDYLMFIDDDVVIPANAFERLVECKADIAAGHTIIRGYPFQNMFFRHPDKNTSALENVPHEAIEGWDKNIPFECDAVGFSCALINCNLLKRVPPPWFVTGPYNTEDIYFCMKARHLYKDTKIVVDLGVATSHGLGSEYIEPHNHNNYREYCEKTYPDIYIPKSVRDEREKIAYGDRGPEYLSMVRGGEKEARAYAEIGLPRENL